MVRFKVRRQAAVLWRQLYFTPAPDVARLDRSQRRHLAACAHLTANTHPVEPYAYFLYLYQQPVYFPGIAFALALAAGLAGAIRDRRRGGGPAGQAALCPRPAAGPRPAASAVIWAPGSPLDRLPGPKFSPGKNALAMRFALRAIAAQPGGYLTAVLHDVSLAFRWTIPGHPSALMTRRYEFAYATRHWISPSYAPVPGHTVASDEAAYGGATATRAVAPFAAWMRAYQRAAYLPGTLLAGVLATGLAGMLLSCRAARRPGGGPRSRRPRRAARRRDGPWGGPALYPWLAALTALVAPVMTADYSQRYVLIAVPLACLAAPLAFARPTGINEPTRTATPAPATPHPAPFPAPSTRSR